MAVGRPPRDRHFESLVAVAAVDAVAVTAAAVAGFEDLAQTQHPDGWSVEPIGHRRWDYHYYLLE